MTANSADGELPVTHTISKLGDLVDETKNETSCLRVEVVTPGSTESDLDPLNELIELESMNCEESLDALLSTGIELEAAVIENVAKAKDGGFQVLLSVSETDAKSVGKLLADLQTVYSVLLIPHDD